MALRPLVTTGIAFAAAGVMALTPAIVPQLTEREKAVAQMTAAEVQLAADLKQLINVFFGVDPAPNDNPAENYIPPVTDAAGTAGFPGVIYQLLSEQQGTFAPNRAVLDQFFQYGLKEVVRQQMLLNNPSNAQTINDFFDGGITQVAYRYASSGVTTPNQQVYLDHFFNQFSPNPALKGVPGVIYVRLKEAALAGDITQEQAAFLEDLFQGGFTLIARKRLLASTSDPVQQQAINDLFTGGITQNVRTFLLSATQDPQQLRDIALFFPDGYTGYAGGITENIQDRFLNATADPDQKAVINAFFDEGIAEVVRLLLVGPKPVVEEEEESLAPTATFFAAPEAAPEAAAPELVEPEPELATGDVEQLSAPVPNPAPAPAVAAAAAPQAPPATVPAEELTPNELAKANLAAEAEGDGAASDDDGNKTEIAPVLPLGDGANNGSGSWGVFGEVAKAVHDTIAGAGTPAAPATDGGESAGDAEG